MVEVYTHGRRAMKMEVRISRNGRINILLHSVGTWLSIYVQGDNKKERLAASWWLRCPSSGYPAHAHFRGVSKDGSGASGGGGSAAGMNGYSNAVAFGFNIYGGRYEYLQN